MYKSEYKEQFLKEDGTSVETWASELQNKIQKIFPKSGISVKFSSRLYPNIKILFSIGKDKSEWPNGYFENDPAKQMLSIEGFTKDGDFQDKLTVEDLASSGIVINSKNPNKKYDIIKFFRKKSGNKDVIEKYILAYFMKLKQELKSNISDIPDSELVKSKI